MKVLSLLWVPGAVAVVVAAYVYGGGVPAALVHGASAIIVLGGTAAATLIGHPLRDVVRALRASLRSFVEDGPDLESVSAKLMDWSLRAHRQGVLALDTELDAINEPYLRQALALAVDGVDVAPLRDVLAAESRAREADEDTSVRVLETAAGYAPTFGMLGAVLGLMQVMSALDEPGRLGGGLATAFVATVYGLTLANAVLLPLAGRLRERLMAGARRRALILDAVVALRQRTHPRLVAATIRGLSPQEAWGGLRMTSPAPQGQPS